MILFSITEGLFSFGGPPLLEDININIHQGDRICLLGRNGAGKSTLMKLIAGRLNLQSGQLVSHQELNVATLEQQVPITTCGSVFDIVAQGLGKYGQLLADYHHTSKLLQTQASDTLLQKLDRLSKSLDADRGWHRQRLVDKILTTMNLDSEADFQNLSAGMKRRVLLAKALVLSPDILLLDEPTNHLDIEAIRWLEDFLLSYDKAIVFVTHDRQFLKKVATRIIEIDRSDVINWDCDYDTYLQRKADTLEAEIKQNAAFDKKLAEEEVWIRKGIQARRTRNEGRVKRLVEMRKNRAQRQNIQGTANLLIQQSEASGRMVIKAQNVSFGYNGSDIVKDFSTTILRGDKIGIIGPNGCGKTTLLNLLLTELTPKQGSVELGTKLQISYFDQLHAQLDDRKTVLENVSYGNDTITINGRPRHIIGYLQDFLFPPQRAKTLVANLSGGERNRLLLARLFTKPANLLVLDEPTNDLDIPTLELLEELLQEFSGTLILVSHDRAFINNVVTSTLVFEGSGQVTEYVGGYDETLHSPKEQQPHTEQPAEKPKKQKDKSAGPRKLNFNEKRELAALPKEIEDLETQQEKLNQLMTTPDFYKQPGPQIAQTTARLETLRQQLADLYARWEFLEQFSD